MGSFIKFIVIVGILSLLMTIHDQFTRHPATGFLEEWIKGFLLIGVITFILMAACYQSVMSPENSAMR